MSDLQQEYQKLNAKFVAASTREQVLILICGLVVVVMMMYTLLLDPIQQQTTKLQQNKSNAQDEIINLQGRMAGLSEQLQEDPNDPVRQRLGDLEQQIQNLNQQLETETSNLVPANKMAVMLESVLADSKGLTLIELTSIAPEAILLNQPEEGEEPEVGLYRHGVALKFEGKYFEIQRYLERLESLPWQFYWKKFEYLVEEHPKARVQLEIYTLSTNKAFLGV